MRNIARSSTSNATTMSTQELSLQRQRCSNSVSARKISATPSKPISSRAPHHIWIGYDHILFLFSLLLPAVLIRTKHKWLPVDGLAGAFWSIAKVITAFTLAHSVTLSVAAFG